MRSFAYPKPILNIFPTINLKQTPFPTTYRGAVFCPKGADASNRDALGFVYMGSLEAELPHTFGEIHFENGDIYQGEFKGGRCASLALLDPLCPEL